MKGLAITCLLALMTATTCPQAAEDNHSADSVVLTSYYALVISAVASTPFLLASEASEASVEAVSQPQKSHRRAAVKLADMQVKSVGEDDNGNPRVYLQVPDQPEQSITLVWHKSEHNPAAVFREGSMISLKPSHGASGWLLYDERETALAFVPLQSNADNNYSRLF